MENLNLNIAPFYPSQKVVAVDAHPQSRIKNGTEYVISHCHYSQSGNPLANGKSFWYVGVEGNDNHWMRPGIFAPIESTFRSITFSEVIKIESPLIGIN